jgi:hypothetical protein
LLGEIARERAGHARYQSVFEQPREDAKRDKIVFVEEPDRAASRPRSARVKPIRYRLVEFESVDAGDPHGGAAANASFRLQVTLLRFIEWNFP